MATESFSTFFKNLLNNDFMPHGHCYYWRPDIVWLHVISDGLIALSYYAIPLILLFFMFKRKDFPFPSVLAMFGAFILLCGTTHVMGIVTLWDPVYRLDGIIKAATALVSVITTIALVPLIPLALALKSPKELAAANAKLAEANEKLKEIDRLKDNFFSNISHELRTPLTLILSPLESFLANDYGTLSEAQRKNLEAMHNNSIRLFQMVNSILDFAKISAKKIEVKREAIDLVGLTKSIVHEFSALAKQKQIQIEFNCAMETNVVNIDRYLYERILFNLLANAIKFTPNDGSVFIDLQFQGDKVSLKVRDTGIGISKLDQPKLFQRFQQVEGSATRRFEGTGLGLSLVKEFSLLLEGDVTVKSEVNRGSCFEVTMLAPIISQAKEQLSTKPLTTRFQKYDVLSNDKEFSDENILTKENAKILIAEDNIELANYIASLLAKVAQTKHVTTGKQALELIKTWEPDVALLDVMMPEMDGISVCKEIKSSPKTKSMPVILLTALTHRDALTRGWEAGADEYLFKPFHPKELLTRIKLLLKNSINNKLLENLNKELLTSARLAGRSEVATSILHNVGNVLNTVNVAVSILIEKLSKSKINDLENVTEWIKNTLKNLDEFVNDKEKQANLILYLEQLYKILALEKDNYIEEAQIAQKNLNIINDIIVLQQNSTAPSGIVQAVNISLIIDEAISVGLDQTHDIQIIKNYGVTNASLDKSRLQQILINLLLNAKDALLESHQQHKQITITMETKKENAKDWLEIQVIDNGVGIETENLDKIFSLGFSTKSQRKGFGLHISALSAQEMGGSLQVTSEGKNQGARFILKLPIEPVDIENWIEA